MNVDTLIDGGLHWQSKWRRDGTALTNAVLEMQLEIFALRRQLLENGIEPVDGAWTKNARRLPFITERHDQ